MTMKLCKAVTPNYIYVIKYKHELVSKKVRKCEAVNSPKMVQSCTKQNVAGGNTGHNCNDTIFDT